MNQGIFNKRKTCHLIPDNEDWKIVEEVTRYVPVKNEKVKADLLKEAVSLARTNKPSRVVIYKADGNFQEDRNYGDTASSYPSVDENVGKLEVLTKGLYYPSESDYPFEIHTRPSDVDIIAELYKISGKPGDFVMEQVPFKNFIDRLLPQDGMDEEQQLIAQRFVQLKEYLETVLADLLAVRIGTIQMDVFITGKTKDSNYIILKSTSIET